MTKIRIFQSSSRAYPCDNFRTCFDTRAPNRVFTANRLRARRSSIFQSFFRLDFREVNFTSRRDSFFLSCLSRDSDKSRHLNPTVSFVHLSNLDPAGPMAGKWIALARSRVCAHAETRFAIISIFLDLSAATAVKKAGWPGS